MIYAIWIDPGSATGLAVIRDDYKPVVVWAQTTRNNQIMAWKIQEMMMYCVIPEDSVVVAGIQTPVIPGETAPMFNPKSPISIIKNAYTSGKWIGAVEGRNYAKSDIKRIYEFPAAKMRGKGMKPSDAVFNALFDNQTGKKLSEHARDACQIARMAIDAYKLERMEGAK